MEMFISLRGILILLLMTAGFTMTLFRPMIGLIIIFTLTILRAGFLYAWFPTIYQDMHLVQFSILLTLLAWIIHHKKYPIRINLDLLILFLFFCVICLSRVLNNTPMLDNKVPDEFLRVMFVTFLTAQILRTPKDMRKILWSIVGMYLFLALRAYWRYKTEYWDIALPDYVWVNRNGFANSLAFVFPIAYFLSTATKNKILKFFGLSTALWCIIGVILTSSRGGFLALMVSLFFVFIHEKRKTMLIFIGLVIGLTIVPRLSEKYVDRIQSIKTYEEDASAMGRVATNYAAINMFKEKPLLGVGAGNYNNLVYSYVPPEYSKWVDEGKSIHNILMQVLSETGIIGFVLFCWLILRSLLNTSTRHIRGNAELVNLAYMLRIAMISIIVGEQFGQGAYFGNIYTVLPFIIALKLNPENRKPSIAVK